MKTTMLAALVLVLVLGGEALAAPTLFIWIDEWGHGVGTSEQGVRGPDPTGGIPNWNVLIYELPFDGTAGDLQIYEQRGGRKLSHIIRFTGHKQVVFYSNDVNGLISWADTPKPPQNAWPLTGLVKAEADVTGSGTDLHVLYEPKAGQPGWTAAIPSYTILIGAALPAPEPATVGLLALGGLGMLLRRRRRR